MPGGACCDQVRHEYACAAAQHAAHNSVQIKGSPQPSRQRAHLHTSATRCRELSNHVGDAVLGAPGCVQLCVLRSLSQLRNLLLMSAHLSLSQPNVSKVVWRFAS